MDGLESDTAIIRELVQWTRVSPSAVADKAGVAATTILRPFKMNATTRVSQPTWDKLRKAYPDFPGWTGQAPDQPPVDPEWSYVSVEVLPTYAGMGGGGTGDGDKETALIPRFLIEDVFRGSPSDFVLIRVRGNSMEPVFHHDDELLVDKRDRSPTQPGPFAIWDAEWGEYVVKNVERLPGGLVRLFPSNAQFSAAEVKHEETRIIGRPVWFGRRL